MTQFTPETQAIILLLAAVGELESKVLSLEDENKELADKLKMNSRNSSKPPSTDGYNKPSSSKNSNADSENEENPECDREDYKPNPKSLRQKSNNRARWSTRS